MADAVEWMLCEDGCLCINENINSVSYHPTLNAVLITTKESCIQVLDVCSGVILQSRLVGNASFSDAWNDSQSSRHLNTAVERANLQCIYIPGHDKVLLADGKAVGLRRDHNGVLLLDTALQTRIGASSDVVKIEILYSEALQLVECIQQMLDSLGTEQERVLYELELRIGLIKEQVKENHKVAKWSTVCLELPYNVMKPAFSNLVQELKRLNRSVPSLSIASAISERLNLLLSSSETPDVSAQPTVAADRSLMFSEAGRRETFGKWPHMNYKWALPDQMAQAGFYHQSNSTGDDRAMCFTCNICLVCWEPTDEPWSEHERHSPSCPFVKGEYTQNVPLSVTYATSPALLHSDRLEKFSCLSTSSYPDLIATATDAGNIVVWNLSRVLKKKYQFTINPQDPFIVSAVLGRQKRLKTCVEDEIHANVTDEEGCTASDSWSGVGACADIRNHSNDLDAATLFRDKGDLTVNSLTVLGSINSGSSDSASQDVNDTRINYLPSLIVGIAISDGVFSHNWSCLAVKESPLVQVMNDVNQIGCGAQSLDIMKLEEVSRNAKDDEGLNGAGNSALTRRKSFPCGLYLLHIVLGRRQMNRSAATTTSNNSNGVTAAGGGLSTKAVSNSQLDSASRLLYQPLLSDDPIDSAYDQYLSSTLVYMNDLKMELWDLPSDNSTSSSSVSNSYGGLVKDENVTSGKSSSTEMKNGTACGRIVRCLELPGNFNGEAHRVSHVVPTHDGCNVLVVVGLSENIENYQKRNSKAAGALFLYHLERSEDSVYLVDTPVLQRTLCDPEDVIVDVLVLPTDVRDYREECVIGVDDHSFTGSKVNLNPLFGLIAVINASGVLHIIDLSTLESVGEVKPPFGKLFVSSTYCSSVERLCVATSDGYLQFIQIYPTVKSLPTTSSAPSEMTTITDKIRNQKSRKESETLEYDGFFGYKSLTAENLLQYHELTKFMNLTPRFSATLPACWTEIQQEQRQRKHPQHLQQQGKANLHTRSWRLQTDTHTWDEHLFEITLPKSCSLGHIDFKFSLAPVVFPPNIQLTLLKQNSKGIGCKLPQNISDVDSSVNFNFQSNESFNRVTSSEFLEAHNAEIVCGPLPLSYYLDLSGHNGVVTFTSSKIIETKARTFLIHLKSLGTDKNGNNGSRGATRSASSNANSKSSLRWQNLMKIQDRYGPVPSLQSLLELYIPPTSAVDLLASTAPNRGNENLKGCDLFQEISITVRCFKKHVWKNDSSQRVAMLTNEFFHTQLVNVICNSEPLSSDITLEHQQHLSLDILNWIAAIQSNSSTEKSSDLKVFYIIESHLKQLIWSCFLDASRSIAHKCSKLIVSCIEFGKSVKNSFESSLLKALLEWLSSIDQCRTSGAMYWFFLLINHVKHLDSNALGRECLQLLVKVVKELNERNDPLHAVLRSRFGLHRTPFDMDLFDVEAPQPPKSTSTPVTYATVVGNGGPDNNANNNTVISGSHIVGNLGTTSTPTTSLLNQVNSTTINEEGPNSFPLFNLPNQHLKGLLEVEPLHFSCSAASDGTKVEKIEFGLSGGGQNPLSLSPNMTICVPTSNGTQQLSNSTSSRLSTFLMDLKKTEDELIKVLNEKQDCNSTIWVAPTHSGAGTSSASTSKPNQSTSSADVNPRSIATVPISPWQHFLQPPSQQILVIERMHSGARRFVVIDFGKPIVLTDFMIPACQDLVSLSVDIWCDREEIDGQRVVVSTDICYRPLAMNDILPPPVCRYLKITAIGRYGMGTTKCRIPMGVFYGYTTVPPWIESDDNVKLEQSSESTSKLQVHLNVLCLLLEDIHCRYSLLCDKLQSLLAPFSAAECSQFGLGQSFCRWEQSGNKASEEELKVITTYRSCIQLQQQLNLVAATIDRLVRTIPGSRILPKRVSRDFSKVCTDKLRVMGESLLVALLSMTCKSTFSSTQPSSGPGPSSQALSPACFLQTELDQPMCELLFRYLAVSGYNRFQTMVNALLVRTCGLQPWWGSFVAKMLVELYHSNQTVIFPQDRVFLLLVSCHDKSILHNTLPSILNLLDKLLTPLSGSDGLIQSTVDLTLVGWVLLFVSFYLDVADGNRTQRIASDDGDEAVAKSLASKDRGGLTSRWDFIQEEWAMLRNQSTQNKFSSGRLCRRKLHKRIMYHKQLLDDLEQAKKISSPSSLSHMHAAFKRQEQLEKKILSKRTAKHFKDIVQLRRAEQAHNSSLGESSFSQDSHQTQRDSLRDNCAFSEALFNFPRSQNLQVARGIVTLLLSMDYTCNVDTFLLACKVLAKIVVMARPAIGLGEIVSQSQLHKLIWRCVGSDGSASKASWGGPWARHAITCLLQDILEGEKLHPIICATAGGGCSNSSSSSNGGGGNQDSSSTSEAVSETLSSLIQSVSTDLQATNGVADEVKNPTQNGASSKLYGLMKLLDVESDDTSSDDISLDITDSTPVAKLPHFTFKKEFNKSWHMKNPYTPPKTVAASEEIPSASWSSDLLCAPTVSVAVDSRMEMGVEGRSEIRLKMMASSEAEVFVNAFFLPVSSESSSEKETKSFLTPDPLLQSPLISLQLSSTPLMTSSVDMLSICFNKLFQQANMPNVNLELLLQLWVSLNESATDANVKVVLPLSDGAISGILSALAWHSVLSIRTWYLAFKVLTTVCRDHLSKEFSCNGEIDRISSIKLLVDDCNLLPVIMKFLSGQGLENGSTTSSAFYVGPTVAGAMHSFIWRLLAACESSSSDNSKSAQIKEKFLRIVYLLVAENGAIRSGLGPLDAQHQFIHLLHYFHFNESDANLQTSIVEAVSALVHSFLLSGGVVGGHGVVCHSSTESEVSDSSCFSSILSMIPRNAESSGNGSSSNLATYGCTRSSLIHSLLSLCINLVQSPIGPTMAKPQGNLNQERPITENSKIVRWSTSTSKLYDWSTSLQTDEHKFSKGSSGAQQSCSHHHALTPSPKQLHIADEVLQHQPTMMWLLSSLASCSGSSMAMLLGPMVVGASLSGNEGNDRFLFGEAVSVGDIIFHLLCTLNSKASCIRTVLRSILSFMTSGVADASLMDWKLKLPLAMSEPLVWLIMRILDCETAIAEFLSMGGVRAICENLVSSHRQQVNNHPSMLSAIMQKTNRLMTPNANKGLLPDMENFNGLINFAPMGVITLKDPTIQPADILLQPTAPHRRARTPAWSYHFYPDESYVELTITLPCAVLLKEVRIQPHLTSLASCPSAVSIEISSDGVSRHNPLCPPRSASGLTFIILQLVQPEIATSVIIRLYKPRDSANIGLSQILLLGTSTFGDVDAGNRSFENAANLTVPTEESVAKSSVGWLRLLHHCLVQLTNPEIIKATCSVAASVDGVLQMCCSLLLTPTPDLYTPHVEVVLLHLGRLNSAVGLQIINTLLHMCSSPLGQGNWNRAVNRNHGRWATLDSVMDIVHLLCTTIDAGTSERIKALLNWLLETANNAVEQRQQGTSDCRISGMKEPHGVPTQAFVHCIATILWSLNDTDFSGELARMLDAELLTRIISWSSHIPSNSNSKLAISSILTSFCYIRPDFFHIVLDISGLFSVQKGVVNGPKYDQPITDDSKEFQKFSTPRNDFDVGHLDSNCLNVLAAASHSAPVIKKLIESGLPTFLARAVYEFCLNEGSNSDGGTINLGDHMTDSTQNDSKTIVSADMVTTILNFFSELCLEGAMRDWLGRTEGSIFWLPLLSILCRPLCHGPLSLVLGTSFMNFSRLTSQQTSMLEVATIRFLTRCCWCHPHNQQLLAKVLCGVINRQPLFHREGFGMVRTMSGFARRLFLQLLLENEKILVFVKSRFGLSSSQPNSTGKHAFHPRFGCGHRYRLIYASTQMTCSDLLQSVTGNSNTFSLASVPDCNNASSSDHSAINLEFVDYLSVAAGVLAKDKRSKDTKTTNSKATTTHSTSANLNKPTAAAPGLGSIALSALELVHESAPDLPLPGRLTLAQLLTHIEGLGQSHHSPYLVVTVQSSRRTRGDSTANSEIKLMEENLLACRPFSSTLQVFASIGGLAYLAQYLPILYPDVGRSAATSIHSTKTSSGFDKTVNDGGPSLIDGDWVKVETSDDIFDDLSDLLPPKPSISRSSQLPATVPPHSLAAFSLFLRLPNYAETLLKERQKAQYLLRLALGVTDDGEGADIFASPVSSTLPTLPFQVLQQLFDSMPLTTDDGMLLRRMAIDVGAIHLILGCLSVLSHQNIEIPLPRIQHEILAASRLGTPIQENQPKSDDKSHLYWAKGTGFGTGSTTQSWDVEQAILRQKSEEEHVTCLLKVLASYINPGGAVPSYLLNRADEPILIDEDDDEDADDGSEDAGEACGSAENEAPQPLLPSVFSDLVSQSCVFATISSYLRNDSVLDMARHVPLYRSLLQLIRAMAVSNQFVGLLLPSLDKPNGESDLSGLSICCLLTKMKACVDTYASRLKSNKVKSSVLVTSIENNSKNGTKVVTTTKEEEEECEGLALLIPDIQQTAEIVETATACLVADSAEQLKEKSSASHSSELSTVERRLQRSLEDRYLDVMRKMQFDTFEMIVEDEYGIRFTVPHHFESNLRAAGDLCHPSRSRRLAQEAVTLSTSLPLSYSSSVFVRCDQDRLDIMKVLITAPVDTPYANGCFEFDVYFPPDYPHSPMMINLETTGHHTVRFNPNLYNDGKVCLSILNTWHGRPEEKWNPQTSSFLQVLVSIQSLILVPEPYFNEPGYERSRGTPSGKQSSREYDSNIRQATVKWAMLEQLRSTCSCFKEAIQRHFWIKRTEVISQCQAWINEMEEQASDRRTGRTIALNCQALKRHFAQLKEEFAKLKPPPGLEDLADLPEWAADSTSKIEESEGNGMSSSSSLSCSSTASCSSQNGTVVNEVNAVNAPTLSDYQEFVNSNSNEDIPAVDVGEVEPTTENGSMLKESQVDYSAACGSL
ncbi:hypothetical protein CHUAL_003335 [Chamberlinius hualienensis]